MADTSKPVGSMRFGPYELSLEHEELRKAGNRLKLTGQAIQVLLVLANNPGKLVTREELQQKLWPGATYGDFEHGLNAAGSDLFVKVIGSDKPLRVTYHGRAAWSPDGRSIALWHNAPADACGLYLIAPLGGPERRIASAPCLLPTVPLISWSPDGKQLAFLDTAKSPSTYTIGLFVLSLDSMEKAMVKTNCNLVQTPAFSPSGDYLAWGCAEDRSKVSLHLQRLKIGRAHV